MLFDKCFSGGHGVPSQKETAGMDVELRGICKRFGAVEANRDVSLTFSAGAPHGVLGENGAGKSTLMKILSGFYRPDAGEILIDGQRAAIRSPADAVALGIGMLHQDPLDFPALRVWETFALGRGGFGARRAAMRAELASRATEFSFDLDPDVPVSMLTIGQRQQLEILRLLSLGVRVLILDEPTTAISPTQREKLFAALRRLAGDGMLIVLVSHKLSEVNDLCGRATVMTEGRVAGESALPAPEEQLVRLMFRRAGYTVMRTAPNDAAGGVGEEVLRVDDLTVGDDRVTVRHASLTVRSGEIVGLAGVEGSGQRLFLEACSGRRRPWDGQVELTGEAAPQRAPFAYRAFLRAGGGYLPAGRIEEGLVGGMTIGEHAALCFPAPGLGIDWKRVTLEADARIARFNIRGKSPTFSAALSGGNQQRLLLALLPERLRLLLLEHPTRGLDLESAEYVWAHLKERAKAGTTVLFVSADLDELLEHSHRILVFFSGRTRLVDRADVSGARLGGMIGGVGLD
jgi:simple sugar transport system ATP-binding protein